MTLKELKNLFDEMNQINLKKQEIYSNDDLSRNQMAFEVEKLNPRLHDIQNLLSKYKTAFEVKASTLVDQIKKSLTKDYPNITSFDNAHLCDGKYIEVEHFYGFHRYFSGNAKLYIAFSIGKDNQKINLFEREVNEDLSYSTDYILGNYNVSLYELLQNNKLPYAPQIRNACWNAIKDAVKERNANIVITNGLRNKQLEEEVANANSEIKYRNKINSEIKHNPETIFE